MLGYLKTFPLEVGGGQIGESAYVMGGGGRSKRTCACCNNADCMFKVTGGIRAAHCFAHIVIRRALNYKCLSTLYSSFGCLISI